MPVTFEIVEAKPWHVGCMVRRLRAEHRKAIEATGNDAHRELHACYGDSVFCRVLLINGRVEALGGVRGAAIGATGYVWLALSDEAAKHPKALARLARQQLSEIMQVKRELATTLLDDDPAAMRFAVFLGFHVEDEGPGSRAGSRQDRRRLSEFLGTCYDRRVPVGTGHAIAVGYHEKEYA